MEEADWLFELAGLLGQPVHELLATMPAKELVMWQHRLAEPRGDRRADWHAAQLVKAIYDVALGFAGKENTADVGSYKIEFLPGDPESVNRRNLGVARMLFPCIPKEVAP